MSGSGPEIGRGVEEDPPRRRRDIECLQAKTGAIMLTNSFVLRALKTCSERAARCGRSAAGSILIRSDAAASTAKP
jgi:hypothetical protein